MQSMYKKILVGVDGSLHGEKALETAVNIAQVLQSDLFVFHSIRHHIQLGFFPITGFFPRQQNPARDEFGVEDYVYQLNASGYDFTEDRFEKMYLESGRQIIESAKNLVNSMAVKLDGTVTYNLETILTPEEYAEKFAKDKNIDLIVLGCIGHHSRTRNILLGIVATKISNIAPCSVLLVR